MDNAVSPNTNVVPIGAKQPEAITRGTPEAIWLQWHGDASLE